MTRNIEVVTNYGLEKKIKSESHLKFQVINSFYFSSVINARSSDKNLNDSSKLQILTYSIILNFNSTYGTIIFTRVY